jgi:hypothetical protein
MDSRKCWREKVTAEMTTTHLQQFAHEMGTQISSTDALLFLNQHGRAHEIWKRMMEAGEEYVKAKLLESSGSRAQQRAWAAAQRGKQW